MDKVRGWEEKYLSGVMQPSLDSHLHLHITANALDLIHFSEFWMAGSSESTHCDREPCSGSWDAFPPLLLGWQLKGFGCHTGHMIAKAEVSPLVLFVDPWPLLRGPESPVISGEQDHCWGKCAASPWLETAHIDQGAQADASCICFMSTAAPQSDTECSCVSLWPTFWLISSLKQTNKQQTTPHPKPVK